MMPYLQKKSGYLVEVNSRTKYPMHFPRKTWERERIETLHAMSLQNILLLFTMQKARLWSRYILHTKIGSPIKTHGQ
jgi:hypothetical protein